jgi:acetyl-CoA carboxylase carboxyltransferase component
MKKVQLERQSLNLQQSTYLKKLAGFLDDEIEVYKPAGTELSRLNLDGLWLIKGTINHEPVAVAWSDFRVKGGSYGRYVGEALQAFLASPEIAHLPLILGVNSLGFRFMEGRSVFDSVFGIIPAINKHKENNLVISLCFGQCLGLGSLIFGLGHYRLAVDQDTTINLAGPDVFKMFFGENLAFSDVASSRRQYVKTDMIHEIVPDMDEAQARLKVLFLAMQGKSQQFHYAFRHQCVHKTTAISKAAPSEKNLKRLLSKVGDESIELFEGYCDRLRAYIVQVDGEYVGVLANPPKNMNNMFTCRALTLYLEAVKLFRFLQLPLLVMLDTPGVDPRMDGNNQYTIDKLLAVTEQIISYPYPKMGIVTGRGYGGANTLLIPKVYGGTAAFVLDEGIEINVMHESIMRKLLSGSAALLTQWEESRSRETPNFSDMIEAGSLDRVINENEIRRVVEQHLLPDEKVESQGNLA